MQVLVVDDDEFICTIVSDVFKDHDVRTVENGNTIEEELNYNPDIILLDYNLGLNESGIDVLKEIREVNHEVRIIMISTLTDDALIEEAFEAGANEIYFKDRHLTGILRTIKEVIE